MPAATGARRRARPRLRRRLRAAGPARRALRRVAAARRRPGRAARLPRPRHASRSSPTSASRRSSPSLGVCLAVGRPERLPVLRARAAASRSCRSLLRRELLARRAVTTIDHEEVDECELRTSSIFGRPSRHRRRARAASDRARRLAALRAAHAARSSPRSAWISTRPAPARRRSGSCARSTTRPPATTATRSC